MQHDLMQFIFDVRSAQSIPAVSRTMAKLGPVFHHLQQVSALIDTPVADPSALQEFCASHHLKSTMATIKRLSVTVWMTR
jgi:hypothetical protein